MKEMARALFDIRMVIHTTDSLKMTNNVDMVSTKQFQEVEAFMKVS